jgi:hypothetical protein
VDSKILQKCIYWKISLPNGERWKRKWRKFMNEKGIRVRDEGRGKEGSLWFSTLKIDLT